MTHAYSGQVLEKLRLISLHTDPAASNESKAKLFEAVFGTLRTVDALLWVASMSRKLPFLTYDLTNLAVVRNFPMRLAFIDMAWGSFVTAMLSGFVYWVGKKIA